MDVSFDRHAVWLCWHVGILLGLRLLLALEWPSGIHVCYEICAVIDTPCLISPISSFPIHACFKRTVLYGVGR